MKKKVPIPEGEEGEGVEEKEEDTMIFVKLKTGFIFNKNQIILMMYDLSDIRKSVMLEEVNNFKSIMMEVITRELKTPLNTLIGLNTCMKETLGINHMLTKKM